MECLKNAMESAMEVKYFCKSLEEDCFQEFRTRLKASDLVHFRDFVASLIVLKLIFKQSSSCGY
jgi:hypothetical protein